MPLMAPLTSPQNGRARGLGARQGRPHGAFRERGWGSTESEADLMLGFRNAKDSKGSKGSEGMGRVPGV